MPRTREEVLEDIKQHPERHRHDLNGLTACYMIGGAVDISLMDVHSQYVDLGTNGGIRCDVVKGPCACGAWH